MPCYHPMPAQRSLVPNANGKFPVKFLHRRFLAKGPVSPFSGYLELPCGRCWGCRLERSRQWAIRCMHESSLYDRNCFVTLTYDEANLPPFGGLRKSDLQKFLKRLRKRYGAGIRFYACGEYGEQFSRPHFHLCLFNFDFADKCLWKVRGGVHLYISDSLASLWPFGFSTVGDVTFESAAYVARYVMKKINGPAAEAHYTRLVPETGELVELPPEFTVMSRRPGIGRPWLDKFGAEVYPDDFVVVNGRKQKPPRFYDLQFEKNNAEAFEVLKRYRVEQALPFRDDRTDARLQVREKVARSKMQFHSRSLENET